MLKKLRLKFVCIIMGLMTVMVCVIISMVIGFTGRDLERESTDLLWEAVTNPGFGQSGRDPGPQERGGDCFVMEQKPDGTILTFGNIHEEDYDQSELAELWELAAGEEEPTGVLRDYKLRYFRNNGPRGLRIGFLDLSGRYVAMGSLCQASVFVALISIVVVFGLSIWLARWAVKPVEEAWQQQRQFVADASHELKTPLTVIMTNAELLQSGDDAAKAGPASSILIMSRQMRGLVEGLLELARVDNGAVKVHFASLQLSELISEGILPFEPLFFERGLELDTQVEPGLHCKGSESHLRQVLEILLDNALKYTSDGGRVKVTLRRQGSHGVLSVAGPGTPISQEDLKNIFKRFYRIDKVRSRDGSYGLGLAIAQGIVENHSGKIWAESEKGINSFHVLLPLN